MADKAYVLLDRASRNFLGEFATFEEAERALRRYVEADASAIADLELWHEERDRLPVDPGRLHRAPGA